MTSTSQYPEALDQEETKSRLGAAKALFAALEELYDEQNGPPLLNRKAQWETAMEKARLALRAWRAIGQQSTERSDAYAPQ